MDMAIMPPKPGIAPKIRPMALPAVIARRELSSRTLRKAVANPSNMDL
jgi:hypothetical protein